MTAIIDLLNRGKYSSVIEKITDFLNKNPKYKTIDYFHFANPIEEVLFNRYICDISSVKKLELGETLDEIYLIYAIAYMGLGKLDEAEKYLKIANKINPVSAEILMKKCELCHLKNSEDEIKEFSCDIFKYTYEVKLLISNYFKLADYYYHTGKNNEMYNHLLNFYMTLATDDDRSIKEDIAYLKENNVQIGFNREVIEIVAYLYDMHRQNGMNHSAEYFKNILNEMINFQGYLTNHD